MTSPRLLMSCLVALVSAAIGLGACSSGPYVRAATQQEAEAALSAEDGKIEETKYGTIFRKRLLDVQRYTGTCKPDDTECEYIWCYTLNLETKGRGAAWTPGPDYKNCKYIDIDLRPDPGQDGLRAADVPKYLEQELMRKGLISAE